MRVYHVALEQEGPWYCAKALEDAAVFTQGKSLDEVIANVREVVELLYEEKDVQIELIVPSRLRTSAVRHRAASRSR